MTGTGYRTTQWLIQRGDRYLQVSEVLYRVAELCDGIRTDSDIAVLISAATRRDVSAADVHALIETKLAPAGIVGGAAVGPAPEDRRSSPLGVQLGAKVIGPAAIDPFARVAQIFFFPGVAIIALAAAIGAHVWLYGTHGLREALEGVVLEPWRMAALGALAFAAAVFHELGHATALRVAGGRARGMGFGFYLVYPVLFTDVTDSYRLGRWRRLLTDVGGFYFNVIFALGVFGAYTITRQEWLLVAIAITDFEILHQLLPLGRLDGYWILADLTGVPDFFAIGARFARRATGDKA
jgi:putative peptide zinc metalloprotease protein